MSSELEASAEKDGIGKSESTEPILKIIQNNKIPDKQKAVLIASYFSGPIPPPDTLKEYDSVVENGAERIFRVFENQSAHRMDLEQFAVKHQIKQSGRGQIFGLIIALVCIALATLLALFGQTIVASVIGGTTVVSLAATFMIGRSSQKKELQQKKKG